MGWFKFYEDNECIIYHCDICNDTKHIYLVKKEE